MNPLFSKLYQVISNLFSCVSEQCILKVNFNLDFRKSAIQAAAVSVLSRTPKFEHETLKRPVSWINGDAQVATRNLLNKLGEISSQVEKMNENRPLHSKYWILDPRNIPKSTGI